MKSLRIIIILKEVNRVEGTESSKIKTKFATEKREHFCFADPIMHLHKDNK